MADRLGSAFGFAPKRRGIAEAPPPELVRYMTPYREAMQRARRAYEDAIRRADRIRRQALATAVADLHAAMWHAAYAHKSERGAWFRRAAEGRVAFDRQEGLADEAFRDAERKAARKLVHAADAAKLARERHELGPRGLGCVPLRARPIGAVCHAPHFSVDDAGIVGQLADPRLPRAAAAEETAPWDLPVTTEELGW